MAGQPLQDTLFRRLTRGVARSSEAPWSGLGRRTQILDGKRIVSLVRLAFRLRVMHQRRGQGDCAEVETPAGDCSSCCEQNPDNAPNHVVEVPGEQSADGLHQSRRAGSYQNPSTADRRFCRSAGVLVHGDRQRAVHNGQLAQLCWDILETRGQWTKHRFGCGLSQGAEKLRFADE